MPAQPSSRSRESGGSTAGAGLPGNRYVNTALGSSMLPDALVRVTTLDLAAARSWLAAAPVHNVCNPSHGNTLDAFSRVLAVDVRDGFGGRVALQAGDACLVLEVTGLPRETREFSDAEIAAARFGFRLVEVLQAEQGGRS